MTAKKILAQMNDGLLRQNPILIRVLVICPALAASTSVISGVGIGLSITAVLVLSNLLISLLRKITPKEVRGAAYIVIISGFVTALEMLLKAYFPSLDRSLGIFIPIIAVNCIVLLRSETFADENGVFSSVVEGFSIGLGFTLTLFLLSSVREIIGAGTFAGIRVTPQSYTPALIFAMPAGAFITLGILSAAFKKIVSAVTARKGGAE